MYHDVVIVGAGLQGCQRRSTPAATSGSLVIAGQAVGGQMLLTTDVDNFPGFPKGVHGAELALQMQQQAERFGAEFMLDIVTAVDFTEHPFRLMTQTAEVEAGSVILAPGTSRRPLNVPGEKEFAGRGVSYCATGDLPRQGRGVVGKTAVEESKSSRWAGRSTSSTGGTGGAPIAPSDRRLSEPQIFHLDTIVTEIHGELTVTELSLRNVKTGESSRLPVEGVFIFVGSVPNTAFLQGAVALAPYGYIIADREGRTNVPGVMAAGEAIAGTWAQIVVAAGSGAIAAYAAEQFLAEFEGRPQPARER